MQIIEPRDIFKRSGITGWLSITAGAVVLAGGFFLVFKYFPRNSGDIPEISTASRLLKSGKTEKAVEVYSGVIAKHPQNGLLYFYRGQAYMTLGDFKKAQEDMTASINLGYPETTAYLWRGIIKGRYTGDWSGQLEDSSRALALDTANAEGYSVRAEAEVRLGRYEDAVKDFNSAVTLEPDNGQFYTERAKLKLSMNDSAGAVEDSKKALAVDPSAADVYFVLGQVYLKEGRISEAEENFTSALAYSGSNRDYYESRAYVREKLGDLSGAVSDYQSAITASKDPGSDLYHSLARTYFRMRMNAGALLAIEKAIAKFPANAEYYDLRARAKSQMGDYESAVNDWRRAVELEPLKASMAEGYIRQARRLQKESRKGTKGWEQQTED